MSLTDDPVVILAALRPDDRVLEREWPPSARDDVMGRILTSPSEGGAPAPPRRHRRRRATVAVAFAGAVALALVVPLLVPSGTPGGASRAAAAAIERLAVRAGQSPSDAPPAGGFRHFVVRDRELMEWDRAWNVSTSEKWVAADGTTWRHDRHPDGTSEYNRFPPGDERSFGFTSPSPGFLAALPTDPDALYEYLREHVSGSSSREEAVFVAVTDMLRTGMPSPALQAAGIRVLSRLPVTVDEHARDALGRPGIAIRLERPGGEASQTVVVDPGSTRVLEERASYRYTTPPRPDTSRALEYTGTVVTADTTNEVPKVVREHAVPRG